VLTLVQILFVLTLTQGCAASKARVAVDPVTESSILDGDATSVVEGCGHPPAVGIAYCRVQEGDNAGQSIFFIGPPAECDRDDACVFLKVWNSQGMLVWGGAIPKGQTRVEVAWKTLLGRDTFEVGHRGFWTWNTEVFWRDLDGKERRSVSQGDLVLRVFRRGYIPLQDVTTDAHFVWSWSEHDFRYQMTSGLRASCLR
jgi:hypothetical protein